MKQRTYFLLIILSILQLSCKKNQDNDINEVGYNCTYIEYIGIVKINSIANAPPNEYNCPNNPKKLMFDFTPNTISDRDVYLFESHSDSGNYLTINGGMNPSQTWIDSNEIEVGKEYPCFRKEIITGTCTPVFFEFEDLNTFPANGCD